MPPVPTRRFQELVEKFRRQRIVVVGDLIADEFIFGRVDRAGGRPTARQGRQIEAALAASIKRANAVILSDYGGGVTTAERWRRAAKTARVSRPPLTLADSRYALAEFVGMTACTPNE